MATGWEVALAQIEAADLPCPVYRTARRLLDRVVAIEGSVTMAEAAFKALCQVEAEGTMRSHLVQLAAAGIIRYRRRGTIFIQFEAWANPELPWEDEDLIAERSNLDAATETGSPIRALSDQKSQDDAQNLIAERSNSASTSHARSGWLVGSLPSTGTKKKPTNQPPADLNDPQQLALGLLTDGEVGMWREVAELVIERFPPTDIFREVDKYLDDLREGRVRHIGVLAKRFERLQPSQAATVSLSPAFRDSELFHRHRLPDEMVAAREVRRNYRPEEYADIILGFPAPEQLRELEEDEI